MTRYRVTDRNLLVIGEEELLFDPGKIMVSECVAMERATGLNWPQLIGGMNSGLMVAVQAAVWILRKRSNPKLRLDEVEFNAGDYLLLDPDVHPDYLIPSEDPGDPELEIAQLDAEVSGALRVAFTEDTDSPDVPAAPKASVQDTSPEQAD